MTGFALSLSLIHVPRSHHFQNIGRGPGVHYSGNHGNNLLAMSRDFKYCNVFSIHYQLIPTWPEL